MKSLALYRDPRWIGGVVGFMEMLRKNFSSDHNSDQFVIGRRYGNEQTSVPFIALGDAIKLYRLLKQPQYDVVHVNPSLNIASILRDGLFMLALRMRDNKRVLIFWHGWESELAKRICENVILRTLFLYTFGWATQVVVLSSQFRQTLLQIGFSPERVSVESTMFDAALFDGLERQSYDGLTLLFLSRLEPEKGIYELLVAFSHLKPRYPNVRLIIAGDGKDLDSMREYADELGVADVSFPGFLIGKDKGQALLNADIFVFPTYYGEGCPVSLIEAMAAGLPCITNSVGGIPDIFHDGANGILLNGVTVDVLEDALDTLLSSAELRQKIGNHNRLESWKKYEAAVVTRRIETLYLDVANRDEWR